jgi:hypothetical protein
VVEINKRKIKKALHDYSVAIVISGLWIVVLLLLILARYSALASVSDISKINPLITSGNNTLVAIDKNGKVTVEKDDGQSSGQTNATPEKSQEPTTNKSGTPNAQSSNNGGNNAGGSGGSTGGSGGSGADGGGTTTTPVFTANIVKTNDKWIDITNTKPLCITVLCIGGSYTYTASVTIETSNSSGKSVSYTWSVAPQPTVASSPQSPWTVTTAKKSLSASWTTSSCIPYTVTFTLTSPVNQSTPPVPYTPSC